MNRSVVLVEDHAIVRQGVRVLIEAYSAYRVVGEAEDGLSAVRLVERLQPSLVLMDMTLPKMSGEQAIVEIKRRFPKTRILALTAHRRETHIASAFQAGADGYSLKNTDASGLVEAMDAVLEGRKYLHPELPEPSITAGDSGSVLDKLTSREQQVARLAYEGMNNKAIAGAMCISVKTVEKHKSNLSRKLGLSSAAEIVHFAHVNGLFS